MYETRPSTGPEIPADMVAVMRHEYGPVGGVRVARAPVPRPRDREVLVAVRAAGIDRGTLHVMTGLPWLYRLVGGLRRPRRPVLGLDAAGVVVAVGDSTSRFAVGDAVFGYVPGALAEYAVAPEEKLAHCPPGLAWRCAAVIPASGCTALQALGAARACSGERVLITGASGGVGCYAVQLAVARGCLVTAVSSAAKAGVVRALGAHEVLDYGSQDPWDGSRTFDVVLDIAGRPSLRQLRRALVPTGRVVMVGAEGGGPFSGGMGRQLRAVALSPLCRQQFTLLMAREGHEDLERLAALVTAGALVTPIGRQEALQDAIRALGALDEGRVAGKAVVVCSGDIQAGKG